MLRRNTIRFSSAYIGLTGAGPLFTKSFGFGSVLLDDADILKHPWMHIHLTFQSTSFKPMQLHSGKCIIIAIKPYLFKRSGKYTRNGRKNFRHNPIYSKSNYTRKMTQALINKLRKLRSYPNGI